ncbi:MAG: cytochrome C [Myxococcaceae bacterium]|nr:cytochrome C [Myxococcaceae bacterium]
MSLGFLLLASALGAAPVTKPPPAVAIPGLPNLVPKPRLHSAGDDTACAKCHVTESWSVVKFNHDRTGFLLKESHRTAPCKACHGLDLKVPQPQACAGCHRDEHQAQLGLRCEGCHDETSWQSHTFNVDAHQRTNFPLLGGHAALPCDECHAGARDRSFARPAVACVACHQTALLRTVGTAVDHLRLGFSDNCRECHTADRFRPARFPAHDRCFFISAGPHATVACADCHTRLSTVTTAGTCDTRTAACTACHQHQCTGPQGATPTDRQHQGVAGYQCGDRRCYECHPLTGASR